MTTLPPDSYTARRLEHSSPEHLHITSRRIFLGPVPEGWLKSHRKTWYQRYIQHYRAPTFTAAQPITAGDGAHGQDTGRSQTNETTPEQHDRQITGLQPNGDVQNEAGSTTGLLRSQQPDPTDSPQPQPQEPPGHAQADSAPVRQRPTDVLIDGLNKAAKSLPAAPKVRFSDATKLQLQARAQRLAGTFPRIKPKDGEVIKADRMLVRIDITQQVLGSEYDERVSQSVETKSLDKWREFMVVVRQHVAKENEAEGTHAVLQLYQTRVIAANLDDVGKAKKKPKVEILLHSRAAKVDLFSSLDKTLSLWHIAGGRTTIYYLRPQSGATSVEWYTFLRSALGFKRSQTLRVHVPDLSVTLRLDDPFNTAMHSKLMADAAEGDDEALMKAICEERGAAGAIIARCVDMMRDSPEWTEVLKSWSEHGHIGLCWKRYDRLEWVHGAVEHKMYGTIAMNRTHDLEVRAKHHYPTFTRKKLENGEDGKKGADTLTEPPPVEGFLIRLTSQKGQERRMGKMLFKRLYFTTMNQYLLFLRPARAAPPPPPKFLPTRQQTQVPSAKHLTDMAPLTFEVDPYPLEGNGEFIDWLDSGEHVKKSEEQEQYDRRAQAEAERNARMLLGCDGFIDLCHVKRVRRMYKGATPADRNLEAGEDAEFDTPDQEPFDQAHRRDDGETTELADDRVFELLMQNGLVIRLQAYNRAMRNEWIARLHRLVTYWQHRTKADMDLFKSVREQNLSTLQIDERAEAQVGSFAHKWEVRQSYASPVLYNMCGIAQCRTIHLSGLLFRKPRRHATFTRCPVILAHGHLLIFRDTLRNRFGRKLVHIHHERIAAMNLQGCYLYSGLLTENDLLYENRTFDSNAPGHHVLPRVYLEDGWTSSDEDAMTTFVIWHSKAKSWFRNSRYVDDVRESEATEERIRRWRRREGEMFGQGRMEKQLVRVSKLGATGRCVVFKARSRAERDHWVTAIQVEIERLAAAQQEKWDDVRFVQEGQKK